MFDRRDGRDAAPGKQHRHDQARTGRGHTEAEANAAARRDPGRETLAPALTGSAAICTACLRNVLLETATLRDQLPVLEAALRDRAVVRDEVLTRTRARLQASDRMMAVAREHKGVTLSPIINALWDRAVREREAVRPRVLALLATQAVRSGHSTASGAAPRGADRRWADAAGRLAALTERGDQSAANPHVAAATAARADRASSDDLHQAYAAPIAQAAAGAVGPHASQPGSSVASVATVPAGTAAPTMSAPPAVAPPAKEPLEAPRLHDLPTGATKYAVRHESSKVALGRGTSLVVRLEGGLQDKQVELTMPAGPARIDVGAQEVIRTTNDHATRIATSLLKAGGKIVDGMSVAGYPITLSLETKLLEGDVLDPGKLTLGQVALKGSVDASAIDGRLYGKFEVVVTIKLTAADLAELAKARAAAKTLQHADDLVRHAKELEARVAKQQAALAKTRVGTRAHKELKDRLSRTRQLLDTAKRRMNQARKASTSAARALSRSASKLAKSALGKLAGKALTTAFKRFIPFY
ncbi:MAG: hypothetical protein KA190_15485, partial [Kofleriaceae bacterium]|nr:hypothetical protein [Kofleriaceae bacterium]